MPEPAELHVTARAQKLSQMLSRQHALCPRNPFLGRETSRALDFAEPEAPRLMAWLSIV